MAEEKIVHLSIVEESKPARSERPARLRRHKSKSTSSETPKAAEPSQAEVSSTAAAAQEPAPPPPWHQFLRTADNRDVSQRFSNEASDILARFGTQLADYCFLGLLDSETYISDYELDRIFSALLRSNPKRDKNVLLFLLSRGGSIEPAYQMSKLCKSFARERFVVAVPRQAKSAATLLTLGADEIHMGPLGHLGPIDPQLGGGCLH